MALEMKKRQISCLILFFLNFAYTFADSARKRALNVKIPTNRITAAGLIVALGIIYGDIGTSPLYVFNAITGGREVSEALIIGSLSCIIWTLTLQTTLKY